MTITTLPTSASGTTAGALLHLVRTGRATTRGELSRVTGLSRSSVASRLATLIDAGLLHEGEEQPSTGGRPAGALHLDPDHSVVLAVAVGRSRSQVGVFDLAGREIAGDTRDHEPGTSPEKLMPDVVERLAAVLAPVDLPVSGVGMSLPGAVDPIGLTSVDTPVVRGWDGVPLEPWLRKVTSAPLHLDNDTSVLTRSELFGRVPAARTMLVLKASTGLALGVVADGRLVGEGRGLTGELGHTRVDAAGDLPCRCGATGCLETLAGGWALVARLQEEGLEARHVRDLVQLALDGEPTARRLIREGGRHIGEVLSVAVNLLHPEVVVVGGDLGGAFDLFTAGLRESLYADGHPGATRALRFLPATHGEAAGLHGCAALAIDRALAPDAVDALLRERA
ncbi:ROK family transcriptional regulator [Nocardioides bruguierae]|uniref:ROK family transcriptional regulator n=1 Tax=Nocardioides bruguierae TaxID=2945102 RepID=A0A9X2D7I5_9ACTN|nr:ROK family transcriptional regulator [Nocardioides bruguierae]MCL8024550.1 ROK family transcriptional regulator [Nocardioides bruguierae]MCM0620833.1 ROK family transcriptional regulator [Nocardioides bruguierae]